MNRKELREHVRKMVSNRVYENIEKEYLMMAQDCLTSVKRQNGVLNEWDENVFWQTEGIGYVYGKFYDYLFNYEVISQKYVIGQMGDGYDTPYEEILGGTFDFRITDAVVYNKEDNEEICKFNEVVKYIEGGYDTVKSWFNFDEDELVDRDTLEENVKKKASIQETSRRQKAIQALNGVNNNIRSMAILTSENPRYSVSNEVDNLTNAQRRENIEKDLSLGHYAWFPLKGQYEGKENSYIVYNISLENALYLGKKYGQESVIFIDNARCEYWEQSGQGEYKKTHERLMKDRLDMSNAEDYFSQISRAFKFQIPFFDGSDENKETLSEMNNRVVTIMCENVKNEEERNRRIEASMNATSGYNRYTNRGELYKNKFK